MMKKTILRALLGFPIGIAVGYAITIVISLFWGGGYYYACIPSLAQRFGSEITAVTVQALLCGFLGSGFSAASLIWELDNWSLARQTFVYFAISAAMMLPVAYLTHWMEHSIKGFLVYFGIFALIFIFIWLIQYLLYKNSVNSINKRIHG